MTKYNRMVLIASPQFIMRLLGECEFKEKKIHRIIKTTRLGVLGKGQRTTRIVKFG